MLQMRVYAISAYFQDCFIPSMIWYYNKRIRDCLPDGDDARLKGYLQAILEMSISAQIFSLLKGSLPQNGIRSSCM